MGNMVAERSKESKLKQNFSFTRCLAAFAIASTTLLGAQQPPRHIDDATIQLMRQDLRGDLKEIIAANMALTEAEAVKFWPVYDRYVAETVKVNDTRYALLKEYALTYTNLTEEQANGFVRRWISLDGDTTKLRMKFISEFEKVISHKKTARFFQLDRRLSLMAELQLSAGAPLIEP